MTRPITPDEIDRAKAKAIPPGVFEVVNDLLAKHWTGREARIPLDAVARAIAAAFPHVDHAERKTWLDFEPAYREAGWDCIYDKPGLNERGFNGYVFKRKQ